LEHTLRKLALSAQQALVQRAANVQNPTFLLQMAPHAALLTKVAEGLEPAVRRVWHQGQQCAVIGLCKVGLQDAPTWRERPKAVIHQ